MLSAENARRDSGQLHRDTQFLDRYEWGFFLLWFYAVGFTTREDFSGFKCAFTKSYTVGLTNELPLDTAL